MNGVYKMMEKNPMGLRLEAQPERTTGNRDYELVEADGGSIHCPLKLIAKGASKGKIGDTGCNTNCAWFFTVCDIPEKLGLHVPKP